MIYGCGRIIKDKNSDYNKDFNKGVKKKTIKS